MTLQEQYMVQRWALEFSVFCQYVLWIDNLQGIAVSRAAWVMVCKCHMDHEFYFDLLIVSSEDFGLGFMCEYLCIDTSLKNWVKWEIVLWQNEKKENHDKILDIYGNFVFKASRPWRCTVLWFCSDIYFLISGRYRHSQHLKMFLRDSRSVM